MRNRTKIWVAALLSLFMLLGLTVIATSTSQAAPLTASQETKKIKPAGEFKALTSDSDYCYLSANWRVNGSATWYGNGLSYTVLSSPGVLKNGGEFPSYSIASGTATTNRWASYYLTSAVGATPKVYRSDHYGYNTSKVTIQVYGGNAGCYMELYR